MKMPWGKYRGEAIEDVSDSYLLWLHFQTENLSEDIMQETESEICRRWPAKVPVRFLDLPQFYDTPVDEQKLRKVYRKLALQFHPDHGGNVEAMKAVNLFMEMMEAA